MKTNANWDPFCGQDKVVIYCSHTDDLSPEKVNGRCSQAAYALEPGCECVDGFTMSEDDGGSRSCRQTSGYSQFRYIEDISYVIDGDELVRATSDD